MKILVSIYAEGLQGVTFGKQVMPGNPEYQVSKSAMNKSANAVISGAFKGGAEQVLVVDAHDGNRNLDIEEIDQRSQVILGWPKELSMVQGVEGSDQLFLVGYHTMAGSVKGVLSHTYSTNVHRLRINGKEVGELWLSAAVASGFSVPVTLVAGDSQTIKEARDFLEDCEFITLKEGLSRYSAKSLSMEEAVKELEDGASRAMKRMGKLLDVSMPMEIELEFQNSAMVDNCLVVPGVERLDGYTLRTTTPDILSAYKLFRVLVALSDIDHGGY